MKKAYGKLTAEQFRGFVGALSEIRQLSQECATLLRKASDQNIETIFKASPVWSDLYELPYPDLVVECVNQMGLADSVSVALQSPDPQEVLLAAVKSDCQDNSAPGVGLEVVMRYLMPLHHSIRSIGLYGCSMCGLVSLVRDHGEVDALFKAVSVDRSVVASPTVSKRIAQAEMRGEHDFFERLAKALSGPSGKVMASLSDMRNSFFILREMDLPDLSNADLTTLMVGVLGVYADTPSSPKNIGEAYRKFGGQRTI